jgi:hypothetical protein
MFGEEVARHIPKGVSQSGANDFGLEVDTDEVSTFKSAACCTSGGYEEFGPS